MTGRAAQLRRLADREQQVHGQQQEPMVTVGAAHDPAEDAADRMAEDVLARVSDAAGDWAGAARPAPQLRRSGRGPGGGAFEVPAGEVSAAGPGSPLPADLRRRFEQGFGADLADVRLHTDERAVAAARSIDAVAYTNGRDIHLDPQAAAGAGGLDRVLAHELAHVVRSDTQVHRFLRGAGKAAENLGGGRSIKGVRKKLGVRTNWDRILLGLEAYEALEEGLVAKGRPSPQAFAAAQPAMLRALTKVDDAVNAWRKANDSEAQDSAAEELSKEFTGNQYVPDKTKADPRTKAARRQAVGMLVPRIASEIRDLTSGRWLDSFGLSEKTLTTRGQKAEGQVNQVQELVYSTENGEFSGFFKDETGYVPAEKTSGRDVVSGITQHDPNFGARSMALYRLDQLLGAGVTARVEFAVHEGKMGFVTESAKGTQASKVNWTSGPSSPGEISAQDEVFRRCLNRLQILDSIALQLDRHMGNYFVQTDDRGKVTGVTGIDLDMAFGKDWNKVDYESAPRDWGDVYAYRGLPKEIDEEFGERILAVSDTQVRDALAGLLGKGEVEATVARLRAAQDEIRRAKAAGMLRKDWSWSQKGVKQVDKNSMNLFTSKRGTSYENLALGVAVNKDTEEAMEAARQRMRPKISQLPELTQRVYERAFVAENATSWNMTGPLSMVISSALASGKMTPAQAKQVAVKLIDLAMEQSRWRGELEVKVQETDPGALSAWISEFRTKVKAIYDEALPKLLGRNNPSRMGTHRRRGN